ncbi:MAG: hypothetical protein ABIT83_13615, partial [Massilia sp.]
MKEIISMPPLPPANPDENIEASPLALLARGASALAAQTGAEQVQATLLSSALTLAGARGGRVLVFGAAPDPAPLPQQLI